MRIETRCPFEPVLHWVSVRQQGRFYVAEGQTQPHKDLFKRLGWKWDAKKKFWWHAEEAAAVVIRGMLYQPESLDQFPAALRETEEDRAFAERIGDDRALRNLSEGD